MVNLKKNVENILLDYDSIMIFINVGLHYISNPIKNFSRKDYTTQITEALSYLNMMKLKFNNNKKKKIRIIWRETSAQHFPTYNGYWPGVKYADKMHVKCVPIKNTSLAADWRNKDVKDIIMKNKFDIDIAPFYSTTLPLWSQHVNGHLRDCTHLCWSPLLYQQLFHYMAKAMR